MSDFYTCVMGQPTITRTAAAFNGNGDNTLIAAPAAGYKIILLYVEVQNESATATTAILKHGSTEVARQLMAQYGKFERDYFAYPLELPEATALVLNLSGANSHGTIVEYVTAPV
jgi:hypothetical protein